MHAEGLLRAYCLVRDLGNGTVEIFDCAIARWSKHLGGRLPDGDDFNDDQVNAWLTFELSSGRLSRQTIKSYRRTLLTLWRWGHKEGHLIIGPRNVKVVKAPLGIPSALAASDVDRLLAAAAALPGRFKRSKVARAAFYRALILLAWDTGLRLGDMLRLTWDDFSDGRGAIAQKKTGWPNFFRLSTKTVAALEAIRRPDEPHVLGGILTRKYIFAGMRCLSASVGLSAGTKKIRKSGASALEHASPGAAMAYLGHKTPGLAAKHYLDPRIVGRDRPLPPPLAG